MAWCDGMEEPRVLISPLPCALKLAAETSNIVNTQGCILSLCHPKSGKPTSYVFTHGCLQELHWFKQSYGSWFLGDYVCEDGSLYITTPVDPIFILLPIFKGARMRKGNDQGMFRQLDEILYVDGYPGYQRLMSVAKDSMQLVCEVKGDCSTTVLTDETAFILVLCSRLRTNVAKILWEIGSSKFYRLDDSKVLAWLCHKVDNLKTTLTKLDKNYAAQAERDTLRDIVSILGEYLKDEPWLTLLCSHLGLDIQSVNEKTPKTETCLTPLENTSLSSPSQCKISNGKSTSSSGRQSKKLKTPTDSQNIKDMFRRATRRGT